MDLYHLIRQLAYALHIYMESRSQEFKISTGVGTESYSHVHVDIDKRHLEINSAPQLAWCQDEMTCCPVAGSSTTYGRYVCKV